MTSSVTNRRVDHDAHPELPAPVAAYLRLALPQGQAWIRLARFEQRGTLRTGVDSRRWLAFAASHVVSPPEASFEWTARVRIAPLVHVVVRDALADGRGCGEVRLLGVLRMAGKGGDPQMSSGALHRYLAEAPWYPTALLPSETLRWTAIGERAALATLTSPGVAVSLEFRFNGRDEVDGVYTPARWGRFGGGYREAPWEGRFGEYRRVQGMLVPAEGEAAWYSGGRRQAVWKGRVESARYELSD